MRVAYDVEGAGDAGVDEDALVVDEQLVGQVEDLVEGELLLTIVLQVEVVLERDGKALVNGVKGTLVPVVSLQMLLGAARFGWAVLH